ncbi:MAG TPA: monovalent cation/H+ antiporter complex subunit F [Enhygromyxa sp.]|nr:monovalent cation/H+ antiporter complex subunit F [Enhygromyxa sp.]
MSGPLLAAAGQTDPASTVIFVTCVVLLFGVVLLLIRALRGPTAFDRILAINAIGTKTVLLVALIAFVDLENGSPGFFLDTSMVYALVNFVATIAILKYIQYRRLG